MKGAPLKQKTPLKRKTPLKAYKSLKSRKGLKSGKGIRTGQKTAKKLPGPYHSIFTDDMGKCHITGDRRGVEPHHIFQGKAGKTLSEKYGFVVPLRSDWHRTGNYSVHKDRNLNVSYKMRCQEYYTGTLGKTRGEWTVEFGKWWGVEDMVREAAGLEGMENRNGSSTARINEGMVVYGIFRGAGGYFVTDGMVTGRDKDQGKFTVRYDKIIYYGEYKDSDIGSTVYLDRDGAERAAENRQDEKDRTEREDFAEQNSRPFGKF